MNTSQLAVIAADPITEIPLATRPEACDGNVTRVINRKAEEAETMSQHLRELVDAIPGAVIVLNAQGQVVDCNRAGYDQLGDIKLGEPWRDIVSRVFLPELDQGELRTSDGRQFSISTRPLGYQPGQILLLSDVTQTRQLQRAAQQNLHLMTMGKMMASLAHQIRTPLSSSMLYLSQIAEGNLDTEKSLKFSSKALARIKHIEKMINDMLVFAHGGQFHMSDFRVADMLDELIEQLQPQLGLHQSGITINIEDRSITINGNREAMLGAIGNLCMNAMTAVKQPVSINIDLAYSEKGAVLLRVTDDACGINESELARIFDPFYTTKSDGTGLGLAVVKSVIESHQGAIEVESKAGEGTSFHIYLPSQQGNKTQISGDKNT